MKFLSCIILFFISFNSYAQIAAPLPVWTISDVPSGATNTIVGYIYQTYAIGSSGTDLPISKDITALRLICSVQGSTDPIIAIYWNNYEVSNIQSLTDIYVSIRIDGKNFNHELLWNQEETLTYRSLTDSKELIDSMKNGHIISFKWANEKKTYYTVFNLVEFSKNLNNFNTSCKLRG